MLLDPQGLIVTNEHLISKALTIKVKFTNRQEYEANVIAADPELDMALLKIDDKKDFPFLQINKKTVRVGERAIVIGNPYGLSSSVTTGVISALGRNLRINNKIYANLIQTDAAINPGQFRWRPSGCRREPHWNSDCHIRRRQGHRVRDSHRRRDDDAL